MNTSPTTQALEGVHIPSIVPGVTPLYVARDGNGDLYLYTYPTTKCPDEEPIWCVFENGQSFSYLPAWYFPSVQWEDTAPTQITYEELVIELLNRGVHHGR